MSEQQDQSSESEKRQAGEAWKEVGNQFQTLGESIARAFRMVWDDVENKEQVQEMRRGLEAMVNDIGKAIQDTTNSPQGQQVRGEAKKAAESLKSAGEQTYREAKPHIVSALRQVDESLQRAIDKIERQRAADAGKPPDETGNEPDTGSQNYNI